MFMLSSHKSKKQENPFPATVPTPLDILLLLLLLAGAVLLLFFRGGEAGTICVVSWENKEITLPLGEDTVFSLDSNGYTLVIVVEKGRVRVHSADCPDKFCVSTGSIGESGEIIVCVPAGVVVRIEGSPKDGSDFRI